MSSQQTNKPNFFLKKDLTVCTVFLLAVCMGVCACVHIFTVIQGDVL